MRDVLICFADFFVELVDVRPEIFRGHPGQVERHLNDLLQKIPGILLPVPGPEGGTFFRNLRSGFLQARPGQKGR